MTESFSLHLGDCLEVLRTLPPASVDAVVTDPPYGLAFMGKRWDYDVPTVEVWAECLRVLKPGGHLLAFAGTRTQHRMAVRIEDAGFEIRDMIAWVYGSGFPKSLDVSKAIDKRGGNAHLTAEIGAALKAARKTRGISITEADRTYCGGVTLWSWYEGRPAGQQMPTAEVLQRVAANWPELQTYADAISEAERELLAQVNGSRLAVAPGKDNDRSATTLDITAPATPEAQQWAGWGTALKPSIETVTWATKPFPPERERGRILANLWKIEARLWLLSSASAAAQSSTSSQSEYVAACATAQWTADDATSTRAALRGLMDTWQCEMATHMSLNIVSSWRRTLEESSKLGSTSIIETESSTTTDWKTLSCCLSEITPESIIQACSLPGGFNANASTAAQIFNASLALLQSTLTLSAIEPATWQELGARQGEDVRPSLDPVIMARKQLEGTVAANVLEHGTGALNVDGCRVATDDNLNGGAYAKERQDSASPWAASGSLHKTTGQEFVQPVGRWPANLIHDGSDEVVGLFPEANSARVGNPNNPHRGVNHTATSYGQGDGKTTHDFRDTGSAARFFYTAKASRDDRDHGNTHPTVKPTDLMRYLCRLVTPPGGLVLDPFMGSGSTGKAAMLEGFRFMGIERDAQYHAIAERRIRMAAAAGHQPSLLEGLL